MKSAALSKEDLKKMQARASKKAMRENQALGLVYHKIENDNVVEVAADGSVKITGKPCFSMVKVAKREFIIHNI
jgi:hypothetical protein